MITTQPRSRLRTLARRGVLIAAGTATVAALSAPLAVAGDVGSSPSPSGGIETPLSSAEQIAPLVQPSVVYELITWTGYVFDTYNHRYLRTDKPFSVQMQCTGFVVNPTGYVATAGHCVDPSEGKAELRQVAAQWALTSGYYANPAGLDAGDVTGDYRLDTVPASGPTLRNHVDRAVSVSWGGAVSGVEVQKDKPAVVVGFQTSQQGDGALLKVDETDLNAIQLADTSGVDINSGVVAVGYPAVIDNYTDPDLVPTFDGGTVSSIKTVSGGLFSVFQLSAELSGGMSGGPAVDDAGDVIGVNSSHFPGEPFNYAVPADRIKELLAGAGVANQVSPVTSTYRDGIRAFFAGDRDEAVKDLKVVVTDQPANGLATDYLKKALALPQPVVRPAPSPGPDVTLLIEVALAVLLGLAGLAAAALLVVRPLLRRRQPSTQAGSGLDASTAPGVPLAAADLVSAGGPGAWAPPAGSTLPTGFTVSRPEATVVIPGPGSAPRYCARCGSSADAGAAYCGGCGLEVRR